MTQQRLAELLAEFEQARDAELARLFWIVDPALDPKAEKLTLRNAFPHLATLTVDEWAKGDLTWNNEERSSVSAQRYIIARDFNEFDPGKADMLWKLQNGGAV